MRVYINLALVTTLKTVADNLYSILTQVIIIRIACELYIVLEIHCQYNNFTLLTQKPMPGDEDFELLISPEDYIKLQAKCQELEGLQEKIVHENNDLSLKIMGLKEENSGLHKKIAALTDDIKYLSQKGIEMSKSLLALEQESSGLKMSMVESEKQMGVKYKNSLNAQKQLESKLSSMIAENAKTKEELHEKSMSLQKILTVEKMSRHIQVAPKSMDAANVTLLTSTDIESALLKTAELERNTFQLSQNLKQFQNQTKLHLAQSQQYKAQIAEANNKLEKQQAINADLIKKSDDVQNQLTQMVNKLEVSLSTINKQQIEKEELEKKCADLKKQFDIALNKSSQQLDDLIKEFEKINDQKALLSSQMQAMKNQKIAATDYTNNLISQIENMKLKIVENQTEIESLTNQINECKSQRKLQNKVNADLKMQLKEVQDRQFDITLDKNRQEQICSKLMMDIQEKEMVINLLKDNIDKLQMNVDKNNAQITKLNHETLAFNDQIDNLKQKSHIQNQKMVADMKMLTDQCQKYKKLYENQIQQTESASAQSQILNSEREHTLKTLQDDAIKMKDQLVMIVQSKDALQLTNEDNLKIISSLQQNIKALEDNLKSREYQIMGLRQKLSAQLDKNQKLSSQLQSSQQQTKASQQMLQKSKFEIEQFSQIQNSSKQQMQLVSEQMNKLRYDLRLTKEELMVNSLKIVELTELNKNAVLKKDIAEKMLQDKIVYYQAEIVKINEAKANMEEEYEKIIFDIEQQKKMQNKSKSKDVKNKDQFRQLQGMINDYLTSVGLNLYESKFELDDIRSLLAEQEKALVNQIKNAIQPFLPNKQIPKVSSPPLPPIG